MAKGIILLVAGLLVVAGCGVLYYFRPETGTTDVIIALILGGGLLAASVHMLTDGKVSLESLISSFRD